MKGRQAGGPEIHRGIPHNYEAERAVLGSCLLDDEAYHTIMAYTPLTKDHFYTGKTAIIWEAIQRVVDSGDPVNQVSVAYELSHHIDLEKIGGPAYLGQLVADVPTTIHAAHFAEIVWQTAQRRRLISEGTRLVQAAHDSETDIDMILAEHYRKLAAEDTRDGGLVSLAEIFDTNQDRIDSFLDDPTKLSGVPSGLSDIDIVLRGWQPGQLYIIGARPSAGKSQFVLHTSYYAVRHHGPVAMFSLEMNGITLGERILAARANISPSHIMKRGWYEDEKKRWRAALDEARGMPLFVDQTRNLTTAGLIARVTRQVVAHPDTCLIVVDYLHLIDDKADKTVSDVKKLGDICRALRNMAGRFNLPVLLVSQLNRASEMRGDNDPQMSDTRGSGEIEQTCDVGILLSRPSKEKDRNILNVAIKKNRHGPTINAQIFYDRETGKMGDLAKGA